VIKSKGSTRKELFATAEVGNLSAEAAVASGSAFAFARDMAKSPRREDAPPDDRRWHAANGDATLNGVPVRDADVETVVGLHSIAKLFRVMAVLLFVVMLLQVFNALSGSVDISYGMLFAEAIRLMIFGGLLWGAGDLADLFVKSHHDLRATRILLGRIAHLVGQTPPYSEPRRDTSEDTRAH
jgi:hypothetical protein